ncbi:hypothetical protein MHYP_G00335250 [Metynnis hypsauchen]
MCKGVKWKKCVRAVERKEEAPLYWKSSVNKSWSLTTRWCATSDGLLGEISSVSDTPTEEMTLLSKCLNLKRGAAVVTCIRLDD